MKAIKLMPLLLVLFLVFSCKTEKNKEEVSKTETKEDVYRIVSLNGTITEILVNLGFKDNIVATDVTSMYPKDINKTAAQLGHTRGITIEAILAQKPTHVFSAEKGLSEDLKKQLEEAKVPVKYYTATKSIEGAKELITNLANDLGKPEESAKLITTIESDIQGLKALNKKPKVMFIYARGAGTLMVAGTDTPSEKMIHLAGGENAVTAYKEYKPLTTEAVIAANPDVLLFFTSGLKSLGGVEGLAKIPALTKTTAVKKKQIITMDGLYLTGFGPRLGKAVKELNEELVKYAE